MASATSAVVVAGDDLRHAVAIADVDEDERPEIADAVHPPEEDDLLADVVGASSPQVCVRASFPSG